MDRHTLHSTTTGDSVDARASKLEADRESWREQAKEAEASWTEEWVIVTTFDRTGDKAFWTDRGRSPYPGNATRYATEDIAREKAERVLDGDTLTGYSLERRERRRGGLRSRGSDAR